MPDAPPPADPHDADTPAPPPEVTPETSEASDADGPVAVNADDAPPPAKKPKVVLCPYCGHAQQQDEKCLACGGLFEPLSRRATQIAMGPWTIRSKAHPFRPGCSYPVLVQMIEAGRVGPMTVLRGPTTRQFWSVARNVPGVSHLVGYCHACGAHVSKDDTNCPSCAAVFKAVKTRNELGLQFPNRRAAEAAKRSLNRLLGLTPEEPEADEAEDEGSAEDSSIAEDAVDPAAEQELAAAAAASGAAGASPASIFEQSAGDDDNTAGHDLITDVLGEAALRPAPGMTNAASGSSASQSVDANETRPGDRPDKPSPLRDTAPPANPAALPPRRPVNWTIWLLVALNVLVAAAIVYFVATRGAEG